MRISSNMGYNNVVSNLNRNQSAVYFDNLRQQTGIDIQSIGESTAPTRLIDLKRITAELNRKENYLKLNDYAISEMRVAEDASVFVADRMLEIRDLSVSSTNPSYDGGGIASLGVYVKGLLRDIVGSLNTDFNGKYIFSGTQTSANNIAEDNPGMNNMPFEIIEDEPTTDNPSGLRVVFKGDNNKRSINKNEHYTESINLTSAELCGTDGIEYFEPIIKMINVLFYNSDGTERGSTDALSKEDAGIVNQYQTQIANNLETINKNIAMFSSKRARIETLNIQMQEEVVRYKEIKSLKEDADMTEVLTRLAKEENVLQYSLNAAARVNKFSLFDYL